MTCKEMEMTLFYLAEDDPSARTRLESHLEICSECRLHHHQYVSLLDAYRDFSAENSPGFFPTSGSRITKWRWFRVAAAVALFAFAVSSHYRNPVPVTDQPRDQFQWDSPVALSQPVLSITEDRAFQARVRVLRSAIAEMQMQSSPNQF